ncbi:hypothetical protein ACL2XG_23015 [Sodalis sp. RH24]|uniref:hypothetical protein n=1 Tax=unclassified Sodalis (in: enterobacteria) TaxID=2636512 RepID=UPI0039B63AEB
MFCHAEPRWRFSPPIKDDLWLAGRLSALAEAGFARLEGAGESAQWWLTSTGATGAQFCGDACYGRMLVSPQRP